MSKMGRLKVLRVVLTLGLLMSHCVVGQGDWSCEEEKACKCIWASGKKTAECKNANLTEIPTTLSKEAQQLDLTGNTINHLVAQAFFSLQLENLQKLILKECGIKTVDQQAFNSLKIIIEIDLSNNRIKQLHRGTFDDTVRLRVLLLNHNHLTKLDDGLFHDLQFLQKVELSNNRLTHIGQSTFISLPGFQTLTLNDNKLTKLDIKTFERLGRLQSLELRKNPWHCDCHLKSFRDWSIRKKLYTKPTACTTPRELQGNEWDEISEEKFACRPEIHSIGSAVGSGGSAQLWCHAVAEPAPEITWFRLQRTLTNGTKRIQGSSSSTADSKTYILMRGSEWANLTIPDVTPIDNGEYVCTATNFGGSVEGNVSLKISSERMGGRDRLVGLPLAVGLGLIAFIFLIMALTLCLCYCRRRRSHHDEKSAEAASLDHHGLGEQEKSLITAINPVVKPPRRYEAPSLTSHGTEMTELNRTLLDNDSVFAADGVGSVVGVLTNGLHEEERMGRATPELDSVLGGHSGGIVREGSISGLGNTSIGVMMPGLSPMAHGGSVISGLGTLSRNTTPYRQYPPDLLAFSGGRNSSPTSQASTAPDSSRLPLQAYVSPSSPSPSVLAVATYAPVGFKTLPHPVRAASATPYSMGHHHPTLSRLGYGTIPRRPRAPSWSSGPPTSPTDRDILEPVYDNLGVRRTADGSSKRSLNKSPEPVYSMRGRPLPSTPTTPSSLHQFTLPRAPRSSPIVRQLNRSAPENSADWALTEKRLQQRQLQQELRQQQLLQQQERQQHELRQQQMQQELRHQQLYEEQQQQHRQQQKQQLQYQHDQLQYQQEQQLKLQQQQEQQHQQEQKNHEEEQMQQHESQEQNHEQDKQQEQPEEQQLQIASEKPEQTNGVPEPQPEQQNHEPKNEQEAPKDQISEQKVSEDETQSTAKTNGNGPSSTARKVPPRPPPKPKNKSANGPMFEDEGEDGTEV